MSSTTDSIDPLERFLYELATQIFLTVRIAHVRVHTLTLFVQTRNSCIRICDDVVSANHAHERDQQNPKVEEQGPVLDVPDIIGKSFRPSREVSTVHLCPTRDSRKDRESKPLLSTEIGQ